MESYQFILKLCHTLYHLFILQKSVDQRIKPQSHHFQNDHIYDYFGRQTNTFETFKNGPEDDDTVPSPPSSLWKKFTSGFKGIVQDLRRTFIGDTPENKQGTSSILPRVAVVGVPTALVGLLFREEITNFINSLQGNIHHINSPGIWTRDMAI